MSFSRASRVAALACALFVGAHLNFPLALADETAPPLETAPPEIPAPAPLLDVPPPAPSADVSGENKDSTDDSTAASEESPGSPPPVEEVQTEAPEAPSSSVANADGDDYVPPYQIERPDWGVQIYGALNGWGGTPVISSEPDSVARAFAVDWDFEPSIIQDVGVLALGGSAGVYPITGVANATARAFDSWQVGLHVKYQARYFQEQIIVPYVGYSFETLTYRVRETGASSAVSDRVNHSYPTFGGMLLLNSLEPSQAFALYKQTGIKRSYLVFEARNLTGASGHPFPFEGRSYFAGLRLEF